jgi:hypothetical protein
MNNIEFGHAFMKFGIGCEALMDSNKAKLLQVIPTHTKHLSKEFIDYDTKYEDRDGKPKNYIFRNGFVLLLIFYIEESEHLFTTLRKDNAVNRDKYFGKEGEEFMVIIND